MTNRQIRNLYADITNRRNFKRAFREVLQEKDAAAKRWEAERLDRERLREEVEVAAQWKEIERMHAGLRMTPEIERLESDLAQSGAAQREIDPNAVDMAPLAQAPRRATRRRLNPMLAALVGGLLIGMKGDDR